MLIHCKDGLTDDAIIKQLTLEAESYDLEKHQGKRETCFVVLNSMTTLWLLQTTGVPGQILSKLDLFVTTQADFMAKSLLVKLPGSKNTFPTLDRTPITLDSDVTVHLVILGATDLAEAIALNAALVAHYPNYNRDHRLRTRITIMADDIFAWRDHLIQRYQHLFDNAHYRTIDLEEDTPHCVNHAPMYSKTREDFVDVEWEFVNGDATNEAFRAKLREWSSTDTQQLTIALCHKDAEVNRNLAFSLPEEVHLQKTPILCYAEDTTLLDMARNDEKYQGILPFGSQICQVGTLQTLLDIAKRINYVYHFSFNSASESAGIPADIDDNQLDELWSDVSTLPKQFSNIFNAMTLGTKMHSLGHEQGDWNTYYAVSKEEVQLLTEVEHNRWNLEELMLGYRPVTDEEQASIEKDITLKKTYRNKKIHYDIRAFNDLRADVTGKNVYIYDMVLCQSIPLIMRKSITESTLNTSPCTTR